MKKRVLMAVVACMSTGAYAQNLKVFFTAARDNDAATLQRMIDEGFNVNTQLQKSKRTPLMEAASTASKDAIMVLLAAGANPNMADTAKLTPLIQVVKSYTLHKKQKETYLIIGALLHAGANINAQDSNGMTALMYAATYGVAPLVKQLVDAGADATKKNILNDTAMDLVDPQGKFAKQIETLLLQAEFTEIGNG